MIRWFVQPTSKMKMVNGRRNEKRTDTHCAF
jgi:hypothetical protein